MVRAAGAAAGLRLPEGRGSQQSSKTGVSMAESTEQVTDHALPDGVDGNEWIPRELMEARPGPLFRRFAPAERVRAPLPETQSANGQPQRRFVPSRPAPKSKPSPVVKAGPQLAEVTQVSEVLQVTQAPAVTEAARPPAIPSPIARRLDEVERTVAKAAIAADRSARNLRTIVMRDRRSDQSEA
jgi:hypothetical protein